MDANDVRQQWADRSGEYSPAYYAYYGPDETSESVRATLDRVVDRDARVLELGCSSGRHLSHLYEHGYENLAGVEVNDEAFAVMAESYPGLYADGTFHADAIENVVGEFDDGAFDAVYSVETLQHLHPDQGWVFDELARVVDDVLVTAEIEGSSDDGGSSDDEAADDGDPTDDPTVNHVDEGVPLYYRDWNDVFGTRGLEQTALRSVGRETVRTFRPTGR